MPLFINALPISGGTMTGALVLASDPTLPLQAATKEYADNELVNTVNFARGIKTFTGATDVAQLQTALAWQLTNRLSGASLSPGSVYARPLTSAGIALPNSYFALKGETQSQNTLEWDAGACQTDIAGLTFTAPPAIGATSGVLTAPCTGITGRYIFLFSSSETRSGILTNGSTAVTWTDGLANTNTASFNAEATDALMLIQNMAGQNMNETTLVDLTLQAFTGQNGGTLLRAEATNGFALGILFDRLRVSPGSGLPMHCMVLDGSLARTDPVGIRSSQITNCTVFGAQSWSVILRSVEQLSIEGLSIYPAGAPLGTYPLSGSMWITGTSTVPSNGVTGEGFFINGLLIDYAQYIGLEFVQIGVAGLQINAPANNISVKVTQVFAGVQVSPGTSFINLNIGYINGPLSIYGDNQTIAAHYVNGNVSIDGGITNSTIYLGHVTGNLVVSGGAQCRVVYSYIDGTITNSSATAAVKQLSANPPNIFTSGNFTGIGIDASSPGYPLLVQQNGASETAVGITNTNAGGQTALRLLTNGVGLSLLNSVTDATISTPNNLLLSSTVGYAAINGNTAIYFEVGGTSVVQAIPTALIPVTTNAMSFGLSGNAWKEAFIYKVSYHSFTVATLPASAASTRTFVSDALAALSSATIGTPIAAGGTNTVPVWFDGSTWRYG